VTDGIGQVATRAASGNQSPVYFWLVWLTTQAAGLNEIALRLPSVIAGVSLVLLAFYVTWRWTGQWTAAAFVALLVALDRDCVFYAQEARPYAWVQLLGLAQVYCFQRLVQRAGGRDRASFVGLTVLLFYVHYTSILLLAGELVYYAVLQVSPAWRPAYRLRSFVCDMFLIAVCLLPAGWHLLAIAARRENWELFIRKQPLQAIGYLFPLYAYVQLPVIVVAAGYLLRWSAGWFYCNPKRERGHGNPKRERGRDQQGLPRCPRLRFGFLLTVCWLFVPLLAAWFLTYFDIARLFFPRYVIVSVVAAIVLAGLCYAVCPWRLLRVACVVSVVWVSVSHSGMIRQYRQDSRVIGDRNQDWRGAVTAINARLPQHRFPVFVRSGLIEAAGLRSSDDPDLRRYCLLPVFSLYRLQCDDSELVPLPIHRSGALSPSQRQRIDRAGGAWFLLAGLPSTVSSIQSELLANWSDSETQLEIVDRERYGYVAVLRLRVDRRESPAT
jgi:hypothetical protein